jgi:hypothetical protein
LQPFSDGEWASGAFICSALSVPDTALASGWIRGHQELSHSLACQAIDTECRIRARLLTRNGWSHSMEHRSCDLSDHNDDCFPPSPIRTPGPVERKLLWLTWRKLKNDGDANLQPRGIRVRADGRRSYPAIIFLWNRFGSTFSEMRFLATWLVWPSRLTAFISLQWPITAISIQVLSRLAGWRSLSRSSAYWEWTFRACGRHSRDDHRHRFEFSLYGIEVPTRWFSRNAGHSLIGLLQFVTGIWLRTCTYPRRWISDSRPKAWV